VGSGRSKSRAVKDQNCRRRFKVGLRNARRTVVHLLSSHGRHRPTGPQFVNYSHFPSLFLRTLTSRCFLSRFSDSAFRNFCVWTSLVLSCEVQLFENLSFGLSRPVARMYSHAVALVVLIALLVRCEACKWWLHSAPHCPILTRPFSNKRKPLGGQSHSQYNNDDRRSSPGCIHSCCIRTNTDLH